MANKPDYRCLRILRKLCVINQNPFVLVQEEIFNKLYSNNNWESRYQFKTNRENELFVEGPSIYLNGNQELSIKEIFDSDNIKLQNYLLEQLSLESDLWYGRNEVCKDYFKKLYPWSWLISHLNNGSLNIELKGAFLRLLNYIYIDDAPHKFQKMERIFKAYESSDQYIVSNKY